MLSHSRSSPHQLTRRTLDAPGCVAVTGRVRSRDGKYSRFQVDVLASPSVSRKHSEANEGSRKGSEGGCGCCVEVGGEGVKGVGVSGGVKCLCPAGSLDRLVVWACDLRR